MKTIFIIILIMVSSIAYSSKQNKTPKPLDKKISKRMEKRLKDYSINFFKLVIDERTDFIKKLFRDIGNNKYLAGTQISFTIVGHRIFLKCDKATDRCVRIKKEFFDYPKHKDYFSKRFKTISKHHFSPYNLDSEKFFIKAHNTKNTNSLTGASIHGTFAKLSHKKYSKFEKYESSFDKLKENGKIYHIAKEEGFKDSRDFEEYRVYVQVNVKFTAHTHIRPVKEKLKKVTVKFTDKHKGTSGKVLYKRLGPGFKQNDFEQTVKLKNSVANNPKEKFTTGHYDVFLKDAFCGCDYPLEKNKILDTYDKKMKEQYEHNFKVDLVKGDITGGIKSSLANKSFLKDKPVRLIPACKDGGLEKSRVSLTNNDGKFTFPSIPKGVYKIKVGNKILGEVKHCRAKSKLTYVGKYNYNDNLYNLELSHKMYSKKKYVGRLDMKLKEVDLQAYPFCEEKYKELVNVYPPSKKDIQDIIDKYKESRKKEKDERKADEKAEKDKKDKEKRDKEKEKQKEKTEDACSDGLEDSFDCQEQRGKAKENENKSIEDSLMDSFEEEEEEQKESESGSDCTGECQSGLNDIVKDYKKSLKSPPYLDKSFRGFNYTFLTKVFTEIPDIKYQDFTKIKKHMKCRVAKADRMFSIRGTLNPLRVPTVGGTLSKNSVYLDYKFSIECLHPKAKFWVPRWMIIAMPTPQKFSKLYKFSKLDNESIKNIWQRKAFEFKSPLYKVGEISQKLVLKGSVQGAKCTDYFTKTECANAYQTEDNPNTKTLSQESSPFDCNENKEDACAKGLEDTFECDEQRTREKKEKEKKDKDNNKEKEKNDDPIPGEGMGEGKDEGKDNKKDNDDPPTDW